MSVVTTTILSDGKLIDPLYELLSLDISKEVNRIPCAQIVLIDGDAAQQTFPISDNDFFEPGKTIEIKLRYEDAPAQEKTVFRGVVVRHGVEAGSEGSLLSIELKDEAVKLTSARKSMVYPDKTTDDKAISQIIKDNGLTAGKIPASGIQHPQLVQYYCSDWDFILSRAENLGLLVMADDGVISLSKIAITGSPKHIFEYGISEILNFEIEADAEHQYLDVQSIAWDIKTQKLTKAVKGKDFSLSQSNLKGADIAKTIGIESHILSSPVPLEQKELQAWADATMSKTRMTMIRGRLSVPGFGDIKPLEIMEVAGIGKRFNGQTLVTGIRHRIDQQGWVTDVQFGLSAERFVEREDIIDVPAAGLLPAVNGLQIGIVSQFEADPAKEFRVKVILPGIDEKKGAVWARLASLYAGKNHGYVFWPEKDDEVIVGFFNDDPRQAVILGAMYSSKNTPPDKIAPATAENTDKAIVTKTGTSITLIDKEKPAIRIETPKSNMILLDEDTEMVQIADQHGNAITMSKDGIEIKSVKDVKTDASGAIEIKGKKDVKIDASGNVEIKGAKVDVK